MIPVLAHAQYNLFNFLGHILPNVNVFSHRQFLLLLMLALNNIMYNIKI